MVEAKRCPTQQRQGQEITITLGITIMIYHCCETVTPIMQVAYILGKMQETDRQTWMST
jgi:hypothetical protein